MEWADLTEEYTSALTSSDSLLISGIAGNYSGASASTEPASADADATIDDTSEKPVV